MSWGGSTEILTPAVQLRTLSWLGLTGKWTSEENKIFESALAIHDSDTPDRWIRVAELIPGKSVEEVRRHYGELVEDVSHIEAGLVPIPGYTSSTFTLEWVNHQHQHHQLQHGGERGRPHSDHERKKGVPWTEEEHRQFLIGLKKYGKGDWKSISRNFVITRTPTQVASHAQKYFLRLSSGGKDKRRSSIHDITTASVPDDDEPPSPSKLPTVSACPSPVAPPETIRHLMDAKQLKEPPVLSMVSATRANGSLFTPQPLYQEKMHNLRDAFGHQNTRFPLQAAAYCRPHVW